jgi:hypothetical protein
MRKLLPSSTWLWGILAAAALAWPARTAGPLDGVPLEGVAKAILIGVVFPVLWWWHPRFLRTRIARGLVIALLSWKALGAVTLVPDGWCVRFEPERQLVKDETDRAPHSWDVRADWRADAPACSAVMRRRYMGMGEFPAWFFNLPPPNDSWPDELDRPPHARTAMTVTGFLQTARTGVLQIEFGPDMQASWSVDGTPASESAEIAPGVHRIRIDSMLTMNRWRFIPRWNGADLWSSSAIATMKRPATIDTIVRPFGGWLVTALVVSLLGAWALSFVVYIGSWPALAWSVGASAVLAGLNTYNLRYAQWAVCALAAAALLRLPPRLRTLRGAFVTVGIPWLTMIVVREAGLIGRFIFYTSGDDFWMYQRFGYRIVMQGYWLEGGTKVFYFQPFYRWMTGLLHLVFGDSSVGEVYWDASCLLVTALLAFYMVKRSAGYRWGLVATASTLAVVTLGAPWGLIGRGLSEITSAGFLYIGAFLAMRSRRGPVAYAVAAGVFASLAFYTRLNNLPMAIGITFFGLSMQLPASRVLRPWTWRGMVAWRTVLVVPAVLGAGLTFFAWRNWHYSGVFSVFYGTQRNIVALWQPGMPFNAVLAKMMDSVWMVLSVHDPAMFDWRALPVLVGAIAAPLAILGVPRLREIPAVPVLFFLIGISAAFIARGWTYQGRFSVHIIGITCALAVSAVASLIRRPASHRTEAPCATL